MGIVHTEITLKNAGDVTNVQRGIIKGPEIRETTVHALVDTGAGSLVINETVRKKLGLGIEGLRKATFGNDERVVCKLTEPVAIHWKDRSAVCRALVTSDEGEVLLGAIPLEDMDLIVNPVKRELVGAHGDDVVCLVM
jgi:clan AA aspartic protease